LKSEEFVIIERSLVENVVDRERLTVKEVELFEAVDRWATEESKREGITPDGVSKRRILGEEIVKAIRFPLMSLQEFASVVIDSRILTLEEVGDMIKYFSDVSTTSLPFHQAPRIPRIDASLLHRCQRFKAFHTGWVHGKCSHRLIFSVNKPIVLHGVQQFGSEGGNYTVSTEVKDPKDGSCLTKQSGTYASEKDKTFCYYGFSVMFDRPVCLAESKEYKLKSFIEGPDSWYGLSRPTIVDCQGVTFTFRTSSSKGFRTNESKDQFPVLFWSARR